MGAWLWEPPTVGPPPVVDALVVHGLRVEPAAYRPHRRPGQWYLARRGRVSQPFGFDEHGLTVLYRLTWPWRWPAEARLADELFRTFDACCKRII